MVHHHFLYGRLEKVSGCVLLFLFCLSVMLTGPAAATCYDRLTVKVDPAGSGNITSPQFSTNPSVYPSVYVLQISYTLTAVPNPGYEFVNWTVNYTTVTGNPITVSVADGQKTVRANFKIAEPNIPPAADAGEDQSVMEDARVFLDGSGSLDPDDGIIGYHWQQTDGPVVILSSPTVAAPFFTAPQIQSGQQALLFQLTVTDTDGATDTDTVSITVQDTDEDNINDPPSADAGDGQTVHERSLVTLDGSGSFDPDDGIRSYSWRQTEGPVVTLSDPSAAGPTFTAPGINADTLTMEFTLTVEDFSGAVAMDSVYIVVQKGSGSGSGGGGGGGCFISGTVR
ncbi:MAG: hypothetical protein AB1724_11840 [Thermodesulfobacteriota bacterium]